MNAALTLVLALAGGVAPALPHLDLALSTDGSASFTVTGGVETDFGANDEWLLDLRGSYTAATSNGLAELISITNDGRLAPVGGWQAGANATLIQRHGTTNVPNPREEQARQRAYDTCRARCAGQIACEDQKFCKLDPNAVTGLDIKISELCPAGMSQYMGSGVSPPHPVELYNNVLNMGVQAGADELTYLTPGSAGLTLLDFAAPTLTAGVSGSLIHGSLSLEGLVNYAVSYTPSSQQAQWCVPGGDVDTGAGTTAPSQSCTQALLGPATKLNLWQGAFQVGYIDPTQSSFRIAGRVSGSFATTGAGALTVSVPMYLNVVQPGDLGKGIVLVSPYMRGEFGPAGGWSAGITVALLGQRSLFSERFDSL